MRGEPFRWGSSTAGSHPLPETYRLPRVVSCGSHVDQTDSVRFELVVAALTTGPLAELGGAHRRISALDLRFPAMTRVGDTVAARAEVTALAGGDATCRVSCVRDEGDTVVCEGSAVLSEVR